MKQTTWALPPSTKSQYNNNRQLVNANKWYIDMNIGYESPKQYVLYQSLLGGLKLVMPLTLALPFLLLSIS